MIDIQGVSRYLWANTWHFKQNNAAIVHSCFCNVSFIPIKALSWDYYVKGHRCFYNISCYQIKSSGIVGASVSPHTPQPWILSVFLLLVFWCKHCLAVVLLCISLSSNELCTSFLMPFYCIFPQHLLLCLLIALFPQ